MANPPQIVLHRRRQHTLMQGVNDRGQEILGNLLHKSIQVKTRMAQKHLDEFSLREHRPLMEKKAETTAIVIPQNNLEKKKGHVFPPLAPQNLSCSYFVSATYDGKVGKAVVKLYEPSSGEIYFWYDNTGHQPYCLTNLSQYELEKISRLTQHPGFDRFEIVEKFDPLLNRNVSITKIVTKDPLAVGGRPTGCIRDIIPEDFPKVSDTLISP